MPFFDINKVLFDLKRFRVNSRDLDTVFNLYQQYSKFEESNDLKENEEESRSHEKHVNTQKTNLKRTITKNLVRLEKFLETGVWKVRTEIKLTDEDTKLQCLIINLNKQFREVKSLAECLYDNKELKSFEEFKKLETLIDKAIDKVRSELKFRETRRDKRKFTFLIDV